MSGSFTWSLVSTDQASSSSPTQACARTPPPDFPRPGRGRKGMRQVGPSTGPGLGARVGLVEKNQPPLNRGLLWEGLPDLGELGASWTCMQVTAFLG